MPTVKMSVQALTLIDALVDGDTLQPPLLTGFSHPVSAIFAGLI